MKLEVPVLVVGAGPAGLMATLLLERLGVEVLAIDRRATAQQAPAAHVVNARTLEICRAAGVDMEALARAAVRPEDGAVVEWVTRLGGECLGRLPFERQGDDQLAVTPTPLRNLSQNRFEPILLGGLASPPRRAWQWESAEEDGGGVTSRCVDLASAETHEVRSQYLIAADGAGSRVRKWLGIEAVGPERIQSFVMIHIKASLRSRLGTPPSILSFVCDPDAVGSFIVHDVDDEAVFMRAFDDAHESLDDYPKARCAEIVRAALDDPALEFRVETVSTWAMTAQVAERYREGRTFLVGDAAHRFPPTGGLGLNSGVQDAHNLAWKLAFVLGGHAEASLLDSYQNERQPIAQANTQQSVKNALGLLQIPAALGFTDASTTTRAQLEATLASEDGRARLTTAIANQQEHFDMPGLQLGFQYSPDAPPPDPRHYEPSGAPGARLPHAWLTLGNQTRSLLDLVPLGRFLLLVGPQGQAWTGAATGLGHEWLVVHQLAVDEIEDEPTWRQQAGIAASGALLVRPDQHVAWRATSDAECDALGAALEAARRGASFAHLTSAG